MRNATSSRTNALANRIDRRTLVRSAGAAAGAAAAAAALVNPTGVPAPAAAQDSGPACGGEEVSLTYGFWNIDQQPAIEAQIEAFRQRYANISISPQVVPFDDYWTRLQTGVAGGQTYDVFWMNAANFPVFASQGALLSLQSSVDAGRVDLSVYPQALIDLYTFDGACYGIPKDFDTIALAYNKDLFDAAGVAYPTAEWTWDDLRAAAEQLTVGEGDSVSQWGFGCTLSGQQNYYNFILQNDGAVLAPDSTRTLIAEPAGCEAFEFLTAMITDDLSPDSTLQQANDLYDTLFPAGVIAMLPTGSWHMAPFHEANPAIDVAPLPRRARQACVIHGLSTVVWSQSPNQCAAQLFVEFLGTAEAQQIQADTATVIPAMNGMQEAWVNAIPEMNLQVYLDALQYTVPLPTALNGPEWSNNLEAYLVGAWNGETPPADLCTQAAAAADEALAQ